MRKALCLTVACLFALLFVSVSNVSAVGLKKIENTEWLVRMTAKFFTPDGDYDGSIVGGDHIMVIGDPTGGAIEIGVPLVGTFPDLNAYDLGQILLGEYTYNRTLSLLRSNDCEIFFESMMVGGVIIDYMGPCKANLVFSTAKAFTGSIVVDDIDGGGTKAVFKLKGKKLGQYPATP